MSLIASYHLLREPLPFRAGFRNRTGASRRHVPPGFLSERRPRPLSASRSLSPASFLSSVAHGAGLPAPRPAAPASALAGCGRAEPRGRWATARQFPGKPPHQGLGRRGVRSPRRGNPARVRASLWEHWPCPGRAVAELSTCYGTTHGAEPLSRQCCPGDKRTGQDRFGLVCAALPSPGRAPASGPAVGGTGLRGALLPRPSHTGASQGGDGRTPSSRVESTAVGPRCLFSRHVRRGSL